MTFRKLKNPIPAYPQFINLNFSGMKRLFSFVAIIFAMFFVSCEMLENLKPSLEIGKEAVSLEAVSGTASFTVTANQDWTADADESWVKIAPASGKASEEPVTVTVTADDNTALEARTATITVTAGELTKTVAVTQAAGEAPEVTYSLVLDKEELEFAAEGAEATFTVTSNQNWTATADGSWVELAPASGEASDEAVAVKVTVAENVSAEARTATITVTAGELTKTVAVTQAAGEAAPEEYVLDGKQWLFVWEIMGIDNALFDLGVTEAGKFYIAYDMGASDPSMADIWLPYFEGTYTITEGEEINTGVVNLVLLDPYTGTELPAEMPYVMTAEDAVTFDTSAIAELFGESVSATAATEKKELYIQTGPELPAEMDVEAVYLVGEYYGNLDQEAYNYYLTVCDEEYLSSGQTSGVVIAIDLYSDVPVGEGENIVPAGEYVFDPDDTYAAGTFSNEYSAVMIDGMMVSILDGVVYVKEDGVDMELYLETGTSLFVEYNGVPDMGKPSEGGSIGNLTEDLEIVSENGIIMAEGYGDYYEVGMNNWMLSIFADAETYSGHALMFEILTDGEGIVGEYEVFSEDAEELYNCFLPGEYEIEDGSMSLYCSWYMSVTKGGMDGKAYAPIVDGQLRITETDGVYAVEFDLYDDGGNNIAGIISGEGEIYAPSDEEYAPATKSQAKRRPISKKGIKAPAKTTLMLKKK